jgi:hypothetical protein
MTSKFHLRLPWTLAILLVTASGFAQSIRVTSWNLAGLNAATRTNAPPILAAAAALKLTGPDVILLQNVPDWKTCDFLAQALKPAKYLVVACSSFRDGTNRVGGRQVAILSRGKAYFSWSEPARLDDHHRGTAGFAFAGIRVAGEPLGFYSVAWPDPGDGDGLARQLLNHAQSVRGWNTNKVEAAFLAGTFAGRENVPEASRATALAPLLAEGFGPSDKAPANPVAAGDFVLSEPAGIASGVTSSAVRGFSHPFVTWDVAVVPSAFAAARMAFKPPVAKAVAAEANPVPPPPPVALPAATAAPPPVVKSPAVQTQTVTRVPGPTSPQSAATGIPAPAPASGGAATPAAAAPKSNFEPAILMMIGGAVAILLGGAVLLRRVLRRPRVTATKRLSDDGATSITVVVGAASKTGASTTDATRPPPAQPLIHLDRPGATHTQAEMLRRRAEAAERSGDREAIRAGVINSFSAWLKHAFVRRLLRDRDELLATQQAATMKVLAVEERLAKIEAQIAAQNLGYQQRIEELTKELITAKDENRELIRNQIRQVRAEMETARERARGQAG